MNFVVYGEPQGKARPRFARGRTYTPKNTVEYEDKIRQAFLDAGGKLSSADRFTVIINACFKVPKSASIKKRTQMLSAEIMPTKRPDLDNIAKVVLDALNGVAYYDDSQVVRLLVSKNYSAVPCLWISITEGCVVFVD